MRSHSLISLAFAASAVIAATALKPTGAEASRPAHPAALTAPAAYTIFVGTGQAVFYADPPPVPGAVPGDSDACGLSFDAPKANAAHPTAAPFADGVLLTPTTASDTDTPCSAFALAPSAAALNLEFVLSYLPTPPPASTPTPPNVVATHQATPTPVPTPTPTPLLCANSRTLTAGSPLPPGTTSCFTSMTPLDNVSPAPDEDVLLVTVRVLNCQNNPQSPCREQHRLTYQINPTLHVYATDTSPNGPARLVRWTSASTVGAIDTSSLSDPTHLVLRVSGTTPVWAGSLPISWDSLHLPFGTNHIDVSAELRHARQRPPQLLSQRLFPAGATAGNGIVTLNVVRVFERMQPTSSRALTPLPADFSQRYAVASWITQYDQTNYVVSQNGPAGLFVAPTPVPLTASFPRLQADANLPLSQQILTGLTVNQNNSKTATLRQNIVAGANAALATATIPPSFDCGSCKTFQDLYGTPFTLPAASTTLAALSSAAIGEDDAPYNLSKVGDLDVGHSTTYKNGPLTLGVQDLFGASTPQMYGFGFIHHVVGGAYTSGPLTVNGLYVSANGSATAPSAIVPPAPMPSTTPLFTNPALPSHVANFGVSVANDNFWETAHGTGEFATLVRNSFDLTQHTSTGFLGAQYTSARVAPAERISQFQAAGGYRWADIGYTAVAGDPVTYPGTGGGVFSVGYSRQSYGRSQPSASLTAYRVSNGLGDGVSAVDVKTGYDFSPIWGVSFESTNVRISEPLLAIQGDPTIVYPAIDAGIMDLTTQGLYTGKPRFAPLIDNTFTFTVKEPQAYLFGIHLPVTVGVGYDFYKRTSSCKQNPTSALYACFSDPPRSAAITFSGSVVVADNFTIGGSFVPTTQFIARRVSPQDRVYNVFVGAQFSDCVKALVTASNDVSTLFNTFSPVKRTFAAELDIERPFLHLRDAHPHLSDLATVIFGYANTDSFQTSQNAVTIGRGFSLRAYPSREDTLYFKLRVGTRPFKQTRSPGCTYAPAAASG